MTTQHMIATVDVIMGCFVLIALGFAVFSMWQLYAELRAYRRRPTYTFTNPWVEVRQYAVGSGGGRGAAAGAGGSAGGSSGSGGGPANIGPVGYGYPPQRGSGGSGAFTTAVEHLERTLPPGTHYVIVHPDGRHVSGMVPQLHPGGAGRTDHEGNEK